MQTVKLTSRWNALEPPLAYGAGQLNLPETFLLGPTRETYCCLGLAVSQLCKVDDSELMSRDYPGDLEAEFATPTREAEEALRNLQHLLNTTVSWEEFTSVLSPQDQKVLEALELYPGESPDGRERTEVFIACVNDSPHLAIKYKGILLQKLFLAHLNISLDISELDEY